MEFKYKNYVYTYREKNEAGQTMTLELYKYGTERKCDYYDYHVRFFVTTKRKHGYQYLKQTGKCGLECLMFAKRCLIDFIEYMQEYKYEGRILIGGDDKRRYEIYKRSLIPIGFKEKYSINPYLVFELKDELKK